jgi:hypothetical protein
VSLRLLKFVAPEIACTTAPVNLIVEPAPTNPPVPTLFVQLRPTLWLKAPAVHAPLEIVRSCPMVHTPVALTVPAMLRS